MKCGCFHCLEVFDFDEVTEFKDKGKTMVCPYCGIDSVLKNVVEGRILEQLYNENFTKGKIV